MDDYRDKVYTYICQNGGQVLLSVIGEKVSIRQHSPKGSGKMKTILEADKQSRFSISGTGDNTICRVCIDNDDNRVKEIKILAISDLEDYLDRVYRHLLKNNIAMNMSIVATEFGPIRNFVPEGESSSMKTVFQNDAQSRFILESVGKGDKAECIVRARPEDDRVDNKAATVSVSQPVMDDNSIHSNHNTTEVSAIGKTFMVANKTKCHYVNNPSGLEIVLKRIQKFVADTAYEEENYRPSPKFISMGCQGTPNNLEILQIATSQEVYILDCQTIGAEKVCNVLAPLLSNESPIKLMHDLREDFFLLRKHGMVDVVVGVLDTQLVAELLFQKPFVDLNEFLYKLDLPKHSGREFFEKRGKSGVDLWGKRPIAKVSLEFAANEVAHLQNAAGKLFNLVGGHHQLEQVLDASASRAEQSIGRSGFRAMCFDKKHRFALASTELMHATRPDDGFYGRPLEVESDVDEILSILPTIYTAKFQSSRNKSSILDLFTKNAGAASSKAKSSTIMSLVGASSGTKEEGKLLPVGHLSDIVLDVGRRAHCWMRGSRVFLSDDETKIVEKEELETIVANLGAFGSDNRAGLDGKHRRMGSLHRFSAMRDRENEVMGITIRVGRNVKGNASMLMDLLKNHGDKSILILGEPGSGKTTIVREAIRKLAEDQNVIVVDTSNEIAGDARSPHSCIGLARRMMVPSLDKQAAVMVECVQNHTPSVMVIDEIGRPREVNASSTVKQRGVRMIASAHGDLRKLLKNKDLNGLVGGLESVTIGDEMAQEEAKRKRTIAIEEHGDYQPVPMSKTMTTRRSEPTFEIIVEVSRDSRHDWRIVHDSASAVDLILKERNYPAQLRKRDPKTGAMWVDWVEN